MSQLNRRTFIKNSALAAAVAGISAQTYAQSTGANGDLRVAVVGFRSRGLEHIKELKKIKGVRIVALCDVDAKVVAKALAAVVATARSPCTTRSISTCTISARA